MKKVFLWVALVLPTIAYTQNFPTERIQKILDKSIDNKQVFGTVISISKGGETDHFAAGNMKVGDQYYIASISKMYTAAVLFKLVDQGKISLQDPIHKYLPESILNELHVFEGKDYSRELTIYQLLTNTSGLSDYFMQEDENKESLFEYLISQGDTCLSFEQIITNTRNLPSEFAPGTEGKAFYSDSNFQLLGKIIENITGKTMTEVYDEFIFKPLNLEQTYLYTDATDTTPTKFYYKDHQLNVPKMMTVFQADGGIVSTTDEELRFLKAHLNGELFSHENTDIYTEWNKMFSPFQYGVGIMKFKFPTMPEMIGHAGANGSFAYYIPSRDIYLTGTINQLDKQQIAYKLIAKILVGMK